MTQGEYQEKVIFMQRITTYELYKIKDIVKLPTIIYEEPKIVINL